jgi:sulfur carrier protein ThiS
MRIMSTPLDDGEVGYKRPPKYSRWKNGQCGNPKRKFWRVPKGTLQIIDELFADKIDIVENDIPRRVTVFEAILLQLLSKEISGDKRALAVRLKYQEFVASRDQPAELIIVSVNQQVIKEQGTKNE